MLTPKNNYFEEWGKRAIASIVVLFIIYVSYSLYNNVSNENEIEENLATTEGYVYKVEQGMRNYNYVYWRYKVHGDIYYNMAMSTGFKNYCIRKSGCEGKRFIIEYYSINPEKSRIVIDNKRYLGGIGSKQEF